MARSLHTVPRAGSLGPAAVIAVLLAVLAALVSPPAHGDTDLTDRAVLVSGAAQAGGEPYADEGHFAVRDALVRGYRDLAGERHSPPLTAALASYRGAYSSPPRSARAPLPPASLPAAPPLTDRHQGRAPPPASGT